MKDPKALFPFLFASSWLGNLLLTVLAFFLAFTHQGPLTPLIFGTVALCILSGNALPICVYLIVVNLRKLELKIESTEVSLRVHEGLKRSEDIMNRLDEAEGSLAKSVLIARQVPERIRESLENVQLLADKINTLELGTFTEAIEGQSESMDSVKRSIEDLAKAVSVAEADLGVIGKDVKSISRSQTQVIESVTEKSKSRKKDEMEVSIGERLDLVFETLESVQDSLDGLLQRIAELQVVEVVEEEVVEDDPIDEEDDWAEEPDSEDVEEPELEAVEEAEPDTEPEAEPEVEIVEEVEPEVEEPDEVEVIEEIVEVEEEYEGVVDSEGDPDPDSDPDLQHEMELEEEEPFVLSDGRTRLIAHAMVGMQNKLFIRGDHPWLSWEDGQQMELIGIGEFAWSIDDLKDPIEVTVLLNDEYASEQGTVMLKPGKTARINPSFPEV